jgi:glycosyltransferase involved in cell wall biosynthesis
MKKVLIWHIYELKPVGGPSGYLFNIQNYVKKHNIGNIIFLSDIVDINKFKINAKDKNLCLKIFNKFLIKIFKNNILKLYLFIKEILDSNIEKYQINIDFTNYDYIYFHTTYELTKYYKFLKKENFNGKIILTTHTPKPTFVEIVEDWYNLKINKIPISILRKIEEIDYFAMTHADILLYPDRYALEPYKKWNKFNEIETKCKFKFIPTGINPIIVKKEKDLILKKYNIPPDSFIISYIGRHNKTKGYDLLKEFGEKIIQKYSNIYFLIAGKEFSLKGLNNDRWIEIGWTDDPFSIINACDLFVLPNKDTFFDLILLEVMYLDKPILLSDTGGNKFFKDKDLDLYYFQVSDLQSMINVFEKSIYNKCFNNKVNKDFIVKNLLISNYVKKFIKFIEND